MITFLPNFDVFEDELSPVQEPTTPEYEKEKGDLDADPVSMGDQGVEEPGEDPEVLMYESWTDKVFNVLIKEQIEEEDMPVLVALARKMEVDPSLDDRAFSDSLRGAMQEIGSDVDENIASSIKDLMNKQNQNKI
jgi:hypothetical protein